MLISMLLDRVPPVSIYDDASIQTYDNYDGPELSHYIDDWSLPPPKNAGALDCWGSPSLIGGLRRRMVGVGGVGVEAGVE